jgi:hypothetical protein
VSPLLYQDARVYGRASTAVGNPAPASFVTSQWLSPFPASGNFQDGVWPSPGSANDYVRIGDSVRFSRPSNTPKDWFSVSDGFTAPS